jgi:hypothetical protein
VLFTNRGGTDITTPLVRISGRTATRFASDTNSLEEADFQAVVRVLGTLRQRILAPGESVRLTYSGLTSPQASGAYIEVQDLSQVDGPVAWNDFESFYKARVTTDDWDQLWSAFKQKAGNTLADFRWALADATTNSPTAAATSTISADTLLFNLLSPPGPVSPLQTLPAEQEILAQATEPKAAVSKSALPPIPGIEKAPECQSIRNSNRYVPDILRDQKLVLRPATKLRLSQIYGDAVAQIYDKYMAYDFETFPFKPERVKYYDGSEVVEGFPGQPGFKNSIVSKRMVQGLFPFIKIALKIGRAHV